MGTSTAKEGKVPTYYDDNFGHWEDMDDPDVREYYFRVQAESVEKTCGGCGHKVRLMPGYGFCNSCADKRERGIDI